MGSKRTSHENPCCAAVCWCAFPLLTPEQKMPSCHRPVKAANATAKICPTGAFSHQGTNLQAQLETALVSSLQDRMLYSLELLLAKPKR
jgi:hypothetical protein